MSGTDSVAQPPEERQSNRTRRPNIRKTARVNFPMMTASSKEPERRTAFDVPGDPDYLDPSIGGGRGFLYEWEESDRQLAQQIANIAAGGGLSYTHTQSVPAAQWVIDHHMGLIPNVLILDASGQQMIAEVRHPSDQTTVVVHSAPYIGTAYLRP